MIKDDELQDSGKISDRVDRDLLRLDPKKVRLKGMGVTTQKKRRAKPKKTKK